MNDLTAVRASVAAGDGRSMSVESSMAAVSWGAIIGGAFVAASLALILALLGVGLGLSATSPRTGAGATAAAIGTAGVVWLIATQAIAAGLGGYLAGRLRVKWAAVHTDEVYFRDTAHGFLVWAVAAVITAAFLTSAALSLVGAGATVAAVGTAGAKAFGARSGSESADGQTSGSVSSQAPAAPRGAYLTDSLFRSDRAATDIPVASRQEAGRIMAQALQAGSFVPADRTYLATMIGRQTGLSTDDAALRVDAVFAQGKSMAADAELATLTAADAARSAAAKTSLWTFVALLVGAFCASLAATFGGRQRDSVMGTIG
jgi:hypothetical protein